MDILYTPSSLELHDLSQQSKTGTTRVKEFRNGSQHLTGGMSMPVQSLSRSNCVILDSLGDLSGPLKKRGM